MESLDIFRDIVTMPFVEAVSQGLIEFLGAETDEAILDKVMGQAIDPDIVVSVANELKIVYTPFHGAGYKLVPEALRRLGVKNLFPEPQQMIIDGSFPTVKSPNPENPEGFYLAIDLAKEVGGDLIIGTDPDSDRVGVMVRGEDGEYHTISGNQMGVLMLDYIITARRAKGTLPANAAFIKTIVTTNMGREIADKNGVHVDQTFTGFKFMAEKLAEYERNGDSYEYLLAYEESYGYMMGDYVRDKDAVTASVVIAEMAAYHFSRGLTLLGAMEELYNKYGWFAEKTLNLIMPGLDGLEKMQKIMSGLRAAPPKEIGGTVVLGMRDYQSGKISVADLGVVGKTDISGSNVLYFELEDSTAFIVRPSGTEPKVKIYILVQGESRAECDEAIERYEKFAETLGK
jgi:phosphoglucomutase